MLKQTEKLIKKYGKALINGTISDASLHELLVSSAEKKALFKKYPASGYVDPDKVTNKNFGIMDGMKDFVLHLAPKIPITVLHEITARLIQLSPATIEKNTFMRQAGIAKVFLAYELYVAPDAAEEHFSTMRMKNEFPGMNDIANLQRVILEPIIEFFEKSRGINRRNSVAGFTEPMPQAPTDSLNQTSSAPTHERIPSEPAPVTPDFLPVSSAQVAAAEPIHESVVIKSDEDLPASSPETIESLLAAHPVSPRKPTPFTRYTPVNSNSTATESSSLTGEDVEANDIKAAVIKTPISTSIAPDRPKLSTRTPAQHISPAVPVATTAQVLTTAATATSSAPSQQDTPQQSVTVAAIATKEKPLPLVARPEAVKSVATGGVPNRPSSLTPVTLPRAAQAPEPGRRLDELNPALNQLIELCRDYIRHLQPQAITDNLASKKLSVVNDMLSRLENPRVPNATQRIRNMSMILTPENKQLLKEQRSSVGVKFLETLLHILTVGLYSKCTKNTFAFWKSHGEVLSDSVENLTKDITNPSMK